MEIKINSMGVLVLAMMFLFTVGYLSNNTNLILFTGFAFVAIVLLYLSYSIREKIDELIAVAKEN